MFKKLMNCQEITKLDSLSYEKPLTKSEQRLLRTHLLMCSKCRRFHKNNKTLQQIVKAHKIYDATQDAKFES